MMSIAVAVLGAGGLGRGMARMLQARQGFVCVAMADQSGFAYQAQGLVHEALDASPVLSAYPQGQRSEDAIIELLQKHGEHMDAIFMALPNLPVTFYAQTLKRIATETPFKGVIVDALKRTSAVETLVPLEALLQERGILYITGAGATPGLLSTAAALAAQSFVSVESVDIHFGVGIANWEQYRATIREDFLHMEGFDAERVAAMSDEAIMQELDKRNGLLELVNMEHADDILLEWAGICDRSKVTVGGVVDTRNAKKPCATTVTVTGTTIAGERSQSQFVLGNETTMVDNVCGPACGFMARGVELYNQGQWGLCASTQVLPRFSAQGLQLQRKNQPQLALAGA